MEKRAFTRLGTNRKLIPICYEKLRVEGDKNNKRAFPGKTVYRGSEMRVGTNDG